MRSASTSWPFVFSSALLLIQLVVVFNLRHINFNKTMIFCSLNLNVKKSELFLTDICLRSWKSLPSVRVNEVLQQLHVSKRYINIVISNQFLHHNRHDYQHQHHHRNHHHQQHQHHYYHYPRHRDNHAVTCSLGPNIHLCISDMGFQLIFCLV